MPFKRAPKKRPADDVLRDWNLWSKRHMAVPTEDDDTDAVTEQVEVVWPEPGPKPVAPYVVLSSIIGSADVTFP